MAKVPYHTQHSAAASHTPSTCAPGSGRSQVVGSGCGSFGNCVAHHQPTRATSAVAEAVYASLILILSRRHQLICASSHVMQVAHVIDPRSRNV